MKPLIGCVVHILERLGYEFLAITHVYSSNQPLYNDIIKQGYEPSTDTHESISV